MLNMLPTRSYSTDRRSSRNFKEDLETLSDGTTTQFSFQSNLLYLKPRPTGLFNTLLTLPPTSPDHHSKYQVLSLCGPRSGPRPLAPPRFSTMPPPTLVRREEDCCSDFLTEVLLRTHSCRLTVSSLRFFPVTLCHPGRCSPPGRKRRATLRASCLAGQTPNLCCDSLH